jgi:hypothetical protein
MPAAASIAPPGPSSPCHRRPAPCALSARAAEISARLRAQAAANERIPSDSLLIAADYVDEAAWAAVDRCPAAAPPLFKLAEELRADAPLYAHRRLRVSPPGRAAA